jgi:hypothetical protein
LENTLRAAINSNEAAPYDQCLTLLDDWFNFPQLLNEVNGILSYLHDFTHRTGDGPVVLSYSAVHDVLKLSELTHLTTMVDKFSWIVRMLIILPDFIPFYWS